MALTGSPYGTTMPRKKPTMRHHHGDVSLYPGMETDNRWYQRAVFYEVLVRGFYDASADGNGDLRGLTERLDYLQWLGVDCIWLLPFYQSPLRDGGYDISDFFTVLPEYGDLGDALTLVEEAHSRGLRVIADLVMNHTSDQHPWFQMSRKDNTNPNADWYVWSDDDEYFGNGDECHMCFHFPLMPRMFMAVRRGQRYPITEILGQTPEIPDGCQWGLFLRNHDELTLEMVTDEERDYMYAEYARDPRMKLNLGIRRRLAPLLENNRDLIKLFHALLFSMPGTPILYYGDEIGMGDNVYLGDRDSVRTPMQWSPDRNAGFSRAEFPQLYLPPLMDSVYGYPAVNVEAQQRDPSSLVLWVKRMLAVRRDHPVFGTGRFEVLPAENPAVLAFIRELNGSTVLCVNNLSQHAQPVELEMAAYEGKTPIELLGRVTFPPIGELPYFVTLDAYGFFWFELLDAPTT